MIPSFGNHLSLNFLSRAAEPPMRWRGRTGQPSYGVRLQCEWCSCMYVCLDCMYIIKGSIQLCYKLLRISICLYPQRWSESQWHLTMKVVSLEMDVWSASQLNAIYCLELSKRLTVQSDLGRWLNISMWVSSEGIRRMISKIMISWSSVC